MGRNRQLRNGPVAAKGCRFCYHYQVRESRLRAPDVVGGIASLHRRYGVRQFTMYELDFFSDRERLVEESR